MRAYVFLFLEFFGNFEDEELVVWRESGIVFFFLEISFSFISE